MKKRLIFALLVASVMIAAARTTQQSNSDSSGKAPSPTDEKQYYAAKDGVTLPSCPYAPSPPLTAQAQKQKFSGSVLAEGTVTLEGKIENIRIIKSPGMGLDKSVIKTLKKWKCKPGVKDGKPVPTITPFQISFRN